MPILLDRREFLQTSAVIGAAAVAHQVSARTTESSGWQLSLPQVDAPPTLEGVKWDKAPCRFCGTGCHVQVGVKDGKVVAIQGDREAPVNKGLLCVKGYHVGLALYGKDRLTQPLLRQKDGGYKAIAWDEAIDIVARRIAKNPKQFGFYTSGQTTIPEGFAANLLMKGGLSNNHMDPNARLCMASAVTGYIGTYGVDEPAGCYDDFDVADVVVIWGNNPAEMHPVLFSRIIDRRSRGEKVEIFDISTRTTRTTEHCQHHLMMKPQGDLAIANGIAHLLIKNGTFDKAFVEKHCAFRKQEDVVEQTLKGVASTFEDYCKAVAPYTPEKVEELSGVPAAQIVELAKRFEDKKLKVTSLWCMGPNQHTQGTMMNNLLHSIHLLSGHFGTPGNAPTSLTGQPSACGTSREVGMLSHTLPGGMLVANDHERAEAEEFWNLPAGRINPKPGYHTVQMFEKFCTPTDKGGDITTLWVQATNPGQSLPNLKKLFQAKTGVEDKFLIVSDVYPTATTELADLILPAALWVEKNGVYGNSERRTQQWFKMVNPPGDARDDCWSFIAVARRLYELGVEGLKDKDGNFLFDFAAKNAKGEVVPIWDWAHYHDINVDENLFENYRLFGRGHHKNLAPYGEYVKHRGLRWPVVQQSDGSWRETRWRFSEFDDSFVGKGKEIDFYHSNTKDGRAQIWHHPYIAPPEVPSDEYPFWLCTGRVIEHWHTGTLTRRIAPLARAMPRAYVEIHPEDAAKLDVQNGDNIRVESRRGYCDLPAWINGRGKPQKGLVFVPFFDETRLINLATLDAACPVSKQPDYKKCAVKLSKAPVNEGGKA